MKKISAAVIAAVLFVAALWSCSKPSKDAGGPSYLQKLSASAQLQCNLPTVVNGTLTFNDQAQYDCYENFLFALVDSVDTFSISPPELLDSIENSLGYSSLRADALAKFEALNAIGWPKEQDIPREHWISSPITRSMLNLNRELQIGNKIVRYVSPDWIAYVDASETALLSNLRNLGDAPTIEQMLSLDIEQQHLSISSTKNVDLAFGSWEFADGRGGFGTPVKKGTGDEFALSGTVWNDFHCSNPSLVKFTGFRLSKWTGVFWLPQVANFQIVLNNNSGGTINATTTSSGAGSLAQILAEQYINYPPGTYHPEVRAKSLSTNTGQTWDAIQFYTVEVKGPNATCSKTENSKFGTYVINPTNVIWGEIKYDLYHDFIGQAKTRVCGYTELHAIDGNGNWNRVKSKQCVLCVKLQPTMTQDEQCTPYYITPDNTNYCGLNTNQFFLQKSFPGTKPYQRLIGTHTVSYNGVYGTFSQTMEVCN